jgi:hypothetical protein
MEEYVMRYSAQLVLASAAIATGLLLVVQTTAIAQDNLTRLPRPKIVIDAAILALFTDEPCHHFEEARSRLGAKDFRQAAEHLRIGAAFLKLEAARATPQGRVPLIASIRELENLAGSVEKGLVGTTAPLDVAFMRAHYALAGHHCVKAAHRCCQVEASKGPIESRLAHQDLRAAATHLERASNWAQKELDAETRELLRSSHLAANDMRNHTGPGHGNAVVAITALGAKLEELTGRKITLAPPVTSADNAGPSIFR